MELLNRKYWWAWLLFFLLGSSVTIFILGAFLKVYNPNAWYTKREYWLLGLLCFIFPFFIMLSIFILQITVNVADNLNVAGRHIYTSPFVWLLFIIVPVFGWLMLGFLTVYLNIAILIALAHGEGEKYIAY